MWSASPIRSIKREDSRKKHLFFRLKFRWNRVKKKRHGPICPLNLAVVSRWRPKIERKTMKISRHWRIHSAREELAFTSHTTSSSMLGSCRVGWCLTWLQSLPPSSQSLQPPAGLGSNMPNFTRLPCFKTKPFATGDSHFSIGPLSSSNLRVENITLWDLYAMKTIAY